HARCEHHLDPVEAIADRNAGSPAVEDRAELPDLGRRASVRSAKILPRRDRRIRRIADGFKRGDAALLDGIAPVFVKVWQQGFDARNGRVDVAVDGMKRRCHRGYFPSMAKDNASPAFQAYTVVKREG